MKRFVVLGVIASFAALSPAPIQHRDPGQQAKPDLSQDALAQAQTQAAVAMQQAAKSPAPVHVDPPKQAAMAMTLPTGATAAQGVANQAVAAKALVIADQTIKPAKPDIFKSILYGVGFLLAGGCIAFALKTYADKVVPLTPAMIKKAKRDAEFNDRTTE